MQGKPRQVYYKTEFEIEEIRKSCLLVSQTLAHVASIIRPGTTGLAIDKAAETFIRDHSATPAFLNYGGSFPGSLCVSINECVVHGFPSDRAFKDGDVVSVDCGVELNGFFGDSAYTFALGEVKPETMKLLTVTARSLYRGIEQAVVGKRVGDIGWAIQDYCERANKYGIVRDLVGHGIGRALHEEPNVQNYGRRGDGFLLKEGLVIAIEPMVNMGTKDVVQLQDGWTIITKDRRPSAHYEHTVAVKKGKADILTTHAFIEEAIKKNSEVREVISQ